MFAQRDFLACIEQQLVERGFGAKRKAEIFDRFDGLTKNFVAEGYGSQMAQARAMSKVFDDLALETLERAKRAAKTLEVQAEMNTRIAEGKTVKAHVWIGDGGSGYGGGVARAAVALLQADPRFSGINVEQVRGGYRNKYHALLFAEESNLQFAKGAFGVQRGKTGLYDIVREIFQPGVTKNAEAARFAKSYTEVDKVMVSDRNNAGGSLRTLDRYFPQKTNAARVDRTPVDEFVDDYMNALDWSRTTWPNGEPIAASERRGFLEKVHETFRTDGGNKVDPKSFSGQGRAAGNALNEHRLLHFKDGDAWVDIHEKYGNGESVFDLVVGHVERMAHINALVKQFGPNPELALANIEAMVIKHASSLSGKDRAQAEKILKNRLRPMFEQYTHANPMDANSPMAAGIIATSNMLTAAKLGSVPFLAMPGDLAQTLTVRFFNNMPLMDGMNTYIKGMTFDYAANQKRATRDGFIYDNVVGATYTTERFSPVATYGPQVTRTFADSVIRLSGLNRHTENARWAAQQSLMGLLYDNFKIAYKDLPFAVVLKRYGIGEAEWDAVRKGVDVHSPAPGVETFRPLDILRMNHAGKDNLYSRFFAMVNQESLYMVPGATLEANITLAQGIRPDSIIGVIGHSFKMYKNFPITFAQMYGRLMLSQERTSSRIGFAAAIIGSATLVGAVGVQMREIAKGRTPLPMDTGSFWGKAFLAGGGASLWGDFLFSGVNEYGRGPGDMVAGPLGGLANDITDIAFGDVFKFVQLSDMDKASDFKSTTASRAVNFLRMNTPGTSLWYARLALDREIWDALDELADPAVNAKRRQRMRKQERDYGNTYWSEPGSGLTGGGPLLGR